MIVVSYMSGKPSEDQIRNLTFATVTTEHRQESYASWNIWDVVNSGVVLTLILIAYVYFTG